MRSETAVRPAPPTIGILQTGVPPARLAQQYGRYDAMMRRMLGCGYDYRTYDVQAGELPGHPAAHPAYVITGSSAGVYDPLPWIAPLEAFIRAAHGKAALVGICFGHQVMAQALGGRVEKSPKGWGLGLHSYDIASRASWMEGTDDTVSIAASHQDQVVAPPDGSTVLAQSTFTPYAALAYAGGAAVSMQFHPEFEHGFAAELVELRRPLLPDPAAAEQALTSLRAPGDASRVAAWLRRFIDDAS